LLISYLPTIYAAHHGRGNGISRLRPFAGTPAAPVPLLANLQRSRSLDNPELWQAMGTWLLELEQTHTSFPALAYFPETSPDQSWVASVGSVLDGSALLLSASDATSGNREGIGGPMLVLANGIPALVRIGRAAGLPIEPPALLVDLIGSWSRPAPSVSIRREEFMAALDQLGSVIDVPEGERDGCWQRFAWIRSGYDLALRGLAGLTRAPPSPWTTDRPAEVGRPRVLVRRPIRVDWTISDSG
ncbi:MAG TPA: hypothetical protein VIC86_06750, partial [Acidimicrobiales bacterium]